MAPHVDDGNPTLASAVDGACRTGVMDRFKGPRVDGTLGLICGKRSMITFFLIESFFRGSAARRTEIYDDRGWSS